MKWMTCSRGHKFQKSSECPVCPTCWPGYYRGRTQGDLPANLPAPALRALLNAKVTTLAQLAKHTEAEIQELHGMGPSSIPKLRAALKAKGLHFKSTKITTRTSSERGAKARKGLWAGRVRGLPALSPLSPASKKGNRE